MSRPRSPWPRKFNTRRGAANILAKPWIYHHNSLNPEEPGDGQEEEGGAEVGKGGEGEG